MAASEQKSVAMASLLLQSPGSEPMDPLLRNSSQRQQEPIRCNVIWETEDFKEDEPEAEPKSLHPERQSQMSSP